MILLYTFQTFKQRFHPLKKPWNLVGLLLIIALAGIYGFLLGKALSQTKNIEKLDTIVYVVHIVVGMVLLFISLVKTFLPYKSLPVTFSRHLPLSPLARYMTGLVQELVSPFFFGSMAFLIVFQLLAEVLPWHFAFTMFAVLFGSLLLRRMFQHILERHLTPRSPMFIWLIPILTALGIASLFSFAYEPIYETVPYIGFAGLVFLLPASLLLEEYVCTTTKEKKQRKSKRFNRLPYQVKLLLGGSKSRVMVLSSLSFKVFFVLLFSIANTFLPEGEGPFSSGESNFIVLLFLMPITLFSYVYNNLWGFVPSYWLFIETAPTQPKDIFKHYVKLVSWPLAIDYGFTILYTLIVHDNFMEIHLGYLLSLIFCFGIGFLASAIAAKQVKKAMAMKGNTAQWANLLLFIPVGATYLITLNHWFYGVYILILLISFALFYYAFESYQNKRQYIYEKLFS